MALWQKIHLLILLTLVGACSNTEMSQTTQSSVAAANPNDRVSTLSSEALSSESQPDSFREAVNTATSAANGVQSATSRKEWNAVASLWQEAVDLMKAVPSSSPNSVVAQKKVEEYQRNYDYARQQANSWVDSAPVVPSQTPDSSFQKGIDKGWSASQLVQSATSQTDWELVVSRWQEAINLLKSVPNSNPNYAQAQKKIAEYQGNMEYARNNAQARANPTQPLPSQPEQKPSSSPQHSSYFKEALERANSAIFFSSSAQTKDDWNFAADRWQEAIDLMNAVVPSLPDYELAQQKVKEYQQNKSVTLQKAANSPTSNQSQSQVLSRNRSAPSEQAVPMPEAGKPPMPPPVSAPRPPGMPDFPTPPTPPTPPREPVPPPLGPQVAY